MNPARAPLLAAILLATALAGCTSPFERPYDCWRDAEPSTQAQEREPTAIDFDANADTAYADMGFDGETWPDLTGRTLRVVDHGAFGGFEEAAAAFKALTGADVEQVAADDAGTALRLVADDRRSGGTSFDVIYGIDNVLMTKAQEAGILAPYTPLLADRVEEPYRFVPTDDEGAWLATPVDRGYIAVNVDPRSGIEVTQWEDLVDHADDFVTEDPRFSSPGLGFLVASVAAFGEDCYLGFWNDLFEGGVTVTSGWTEAYVDRFSGGYGQYEEGTRGDKSVVTSYTTSPAYEVYYEAETLNDVLLAPQSVFEQVQTMAIVEGTTERAAAEAWVEFTLTDDFQVLAAPWNAIYPVVQNDATDASVTDVYGLNAPEPDDLVVAHLTHEQVGRGVDDWVRHWTDLYDSHRA